MRAFWSSVGAVALIALLGSPPATPDATTPSGASNSESYAPLLEAPARFLTSTAVSEGLQDWTSGIPREFYFSRVAYSGFGSRRGGRGRGSWATDYPEADQIFLSFIDRLLPNLDAYEHEFVVLLDHPDLRRFPFLYALEVGRMSLSPPEIDGLRNYLLAGGFLVIDDFWGEWEWAQFESEIRQVLPGYEIVDLPLDHNIFTTFYEIEEILQVPNISNARRGGPTWECYTRCFPIVKGIHDENGRLMVIINFNTDVGDAWEHADDPTYPLKYSTYAYEMGVNFIVYAMSH